MNAISGFIDPNILFGRSEGIHTQACPTCRRPDTKRDGLISRQCSEVRRVGTQTHYNRGLRMRSGSVLSWAAAPVRKEMRWLRNLRH